MRRYLDRLREYRDVLNRLNVYPVPDGDTGTNMTLTVESVVETAESTESMADLTAAIAHGSLMGAQGNSGIILSQILRGLADAFGSDEAIGSEHLVDALDRASTAAYKAVGSPVEGTILTVLREASEAASQSIAGEEAAPLMRRVYERAEQALEHTPELLPVLKDAGVVDAGGAGLLLLLAAFLEELSGEDVALPGGVFRTSPVGAVPEAAQDVIADLRYEVMFLLEAGDDDGSADEGDRLREAWADIGDSIVVVGGDGTWNCHIHTDHIGQAIEAGIALGHPHRIKVTDLLDQAADESLHRPADAFDPLPPFANAEVGVVAVGIGEGVIGLFRDAGTQGMVIGGQTMNPSVRDLLAVVDDVAARVVVVLPNNKNIVPVAEQLDALSPKRIHVVPTRSIPQGLAAMLAYIPGGDGKSLTEAMVAAAADVVSGEVTRAVRAASTPAGEIAEGDWLGVIDGAVRIVHSQCGATLVALLGEMVALDAEVVSLIIGRDADESVTDAALAWLDEHRPDVQVERIDGGQPLYPYLVGVE